MIERVSQDKEALERHNDSLKNKRSANSFHSFSFPVSWEVRAGLGCFNVRAFLHGGGGAQVGEVTRLGWVTRLSI